MNTNLQTKPKQSFTLYCCNIGCPKIERHPQIYIIQVYNTNTPALSINIIIIHANVTFPYRDLAQVKNN